MTTRPDARLTPEEYLRIERAAEGKSEYIDGEMFAMAGASARHVLIATNLVSELRDRLRDGPCIVCDPPQFADENLDTLTNPKVIAEVLSDSTEKYDRGAKFERYRTVPTLTEYLLISQDRVHVEVYTRQTDEGWFLREWNDPHAEIDLVSLRCSFRVAELYAKVTLGDTPSA